MANISRNFSNITATLDQQEMVTNFNNMLKAIKENRSINL